LVELHVFYVPAEVWNFKLNTVPVALTSKFISAGFIRVSPHITLRVLREKLGEYLGGVIVADKFKFLKCIGKKLVVVKAKQETELELKSFAPPYALYPELYLLPGVGYFEDVYPLPSSTQQKHHFIEEANRFGLGSRLSNQSGSDGPFFTPSHSNPADQESGKCDLVLQSSEQNHLSQDQEDCDAPKWNDKSKGTALTHVNHGDEQGQDNQRLQNHINEHQKETKLRRNRTQDAEIFEIMEDQTTDYVHKKQRVFRCLLNRIVISLENKMAEQLQQMKKDRRHMEKSREELIKKAKGLLEQNKLRRYHVREEWKKKYFETKKATVSLEDTLNKLRQDLELYHQKLLLQLEARASRQRPNNTTNSKNYTIIQIATVQHELDQLRKKLDDTKMKLIIEIKMRKQAASDLRALRAELTQKKIHSALILQSRKSGI
ncbi:Spermatogenesis-associated protein 1, partial [Corvus brachyrhynchos]